MPVEARDVFIARRTVRAHVGEIDVEATVDGLRRVRLPRTRPSYKLSQGVPAAGSPGGEASDNLSQGRPATVRAEAREAAKGCADAAVGQIEEYLAGEREEFGLALDWRGTTPTDRRVLETLCEVAPYGTTVTYGELGRRAGVEDPRDVGVVMARNPLPLVVPCHRVVASDGLGGYGGGLELKRRLLELEGVLPPPLDLGDV